LRRIFGLLIALQVVWGGLYVHRTSIVVDGERHCSASQTGTSRGWKSIASSPATRSGTGTTSFTPGART
jgi:hypothetical protein